MRSQLPVSYTNTVFGLKRSSQGEKIFGSDVRFRYKDEELSPGPGRYEQFDNSINQIDKPIKAKALAMSQVGGKDNAFG